MSEHVTSANLTLFQSSNKKPPLLLPKFLLKKASYFSETELEKINLAYYVACHAHDGQRRMDGSAYITHPEEVVSILLDYKMDQQSICAGFMHDVLEDSDISKNTLEKMFGKETISIVDGLSKLKKIPFDNIAEKDANNFQKMALAREKLKL